LIQKIIFEKFEAMTSPFTNTTIDIENLPRFEDVVLNNIDKKYWRVILINLFIFITLLGVALSILIIFTEHFRTNWWIYLLGLLGFSVFLLILYSASFKRRGFALREKDILYKSGVLAESTTIVPLNRIQHIALNEGIFSRIYGLATLQIYTASGNTGEIQISGIELQQAKNIKEALLNRLPVNTEL
jgi:membrane protein YdbS with pleckstrin-like domain